MPLNMPQLPDRFSPLIAALILAWIPATVLAAEKNQGFLPFADAPINYRSSELNDPVAKLDQRLQRGDIKLHYDSQHGYLKSVLDALHISVGSQTLIFSKTSF